MKIIITAANGYLGRQLCTYFKDQNHEVVALVRSNKWQMDGVKTVCWDGKTRGKWTKEIKSCDVLINLVGRSVNCRYNSKNMKAIYSSRLDSTEILGEAISQYSERPKVWLNAASATIYGHSETLPNTDSLHKIGDGFSVDVCQKWEAQFFHFNNLGIRQIAMRTAIVLTENGSVMTPFKNLVKCGLGGKMGAGNQMISWISGEDWCRAIDFCIRHSQLSGPINFAAPNPITNERFMYKLRKWKKVPIGLPAPAWLLKIGTWLIGTEAELVLKSRFVLPETLLNAGFKFRFNSIDQLIEGFKK